MNVAKLYEQKQGRPIISFEMSRAKNDKAAEKLDKALDKLTLAEPDYFSVTFGAGGSTREGTFELVDELIRERSVPTVAYLAGVGLSPAELEACLDRYKELGVETVFAIRGDPPTWEEGWTPHDHSLHHASDLLEFIGKRHDFCLGAAAYPEGHLEAKSLEEDLEYVKLKQDKGAQYFVAQYFYDNRFFYDFMDKAEAAGVTVPIFPGIMPIYTEKMMENLARVCGATITEEVRQGLAALPDEKGAVGRFGIEFATRQCRDLLRQGVKGLHFYTMNRWKATTSILDKLREEGEL
jgi:methylenetetrahydrofolate reductase (NADPH)